MKLRTPFVALCLLGVFAACSSIDCPLNNTVYTKWKLEGPVTSLDDTLTILTVRHDGTDSVVINRQSPTDSFSLPVSYGGDEDIFYFDLDGNRDTVWVQKTNQPHFESVDCGVNYFHELTGVRSTHHYIDSLTIHYPSVTYDELQNHIYIYFKEYRY